MQRLNEPQISFSTCMTFDIPLSCLLHKQAIAVGLLLVVMFLCAHELLRMSVEFHLFQLGLTHIG